MPSGRLTPSSQMKRPPIWYARLHPASQATSGPSELKLCVTGKDSGRKSFRISIIGHASTSSLFPLPRWPVQLAMRIFPWCPTPPGTRFRPPPSPQASERTWMWLSRCGTRDISVRNNPPTPRRRIVKWSRRHLSRHSTTTRTVEVAHLSRTSSPWMPKNPGFCSTRSRERHTSPKPVCSRSSRVLAPIPSCVMSSMTRPLPPSTARHVGSSRGPSMATMAAWTFRYTRLASTGRIRWHR
mmetsp:Transcript_18204/g.41472  ORF Transcript_18204/g.41472 Transcript_18204/m.41472 type:complete len:240 (+) Transcript_18204:487-1206(+)